MEIAAPQGREETIALNSQKARDPTEEVGRKAVLNIIKILVANALSLRNLAPEDWFRQQAIVKAMAFFKRRERAAPEDERINSIIDWISALPNDLLGERILRNLVILVCSDPSRPIDSLIESYEFDFESAPMGTQLQPNEVGRREVTRRLAYAVDMMKKGFRESISPLPGATLVLNEFAPYQYEVPTGVRMDPSVGRLGFAPRATRRYKLLEVTTKFHRVSFHMRVTNGN